MAVTYKCPSCGAAMQFDSETQKLRCSYCNATVGISEYQAIEDMKNATKDTSDSVHSGHTEFQNQNSNMNSESQKENVKVYSCQSCGAQLITDEFTTAVICSFCGNPSLVEDRIYDDIPSLVIPFKISREKAVELYRGWLKKAPLLPKELARSRMVEKISGLYVPYWLYDFAASDYMEASATKTRTQSDGDYRYIYTDHYKIIRDTYSEFQKVPADASKKMEDELMDRLEPYNYEELVKFEMPYLSGFLSEKYNFTAQELEHRPKERVEEYVTTLTRETIRGYSSINVTNNSIQMESRGGKYALLPVWVLNYRLKDHDYQFIINGQTGKIVADRPPISTKKAAAWGSIVFAAAFMLSFIVGMFV